MAESGKKSTPALIAMAWLVVVLPAAWGLTFTVQNALKIFSAGKPSHSAPAATPGAGGGSAPAANPVK